MAPGDKVKLKCQIKSRQLAHKNVVGSRVVDVYEVGVRLELAEDGKDL